MRARGGQDRPDPAQAAPAYRNLDDVLRRALHAAADPIEPAGDGLTRIQQRLATPSAVRQVALLVTDCVDLARLMTIWLEPAVMGATRLRRRHDAGYGREVAHPATRATARLAGPWLRPALAVASAAMIVVIAAVVLGPVRQIVTRTSLNTGTGASPPGAGGQPAGGGHGQSSTTNLTRTAPTRPGTTSARAGRASHRPGTTPTPSPAVTPSGSSTGSPSQSPGPTPTPSKTNHGHPKPHPGKTNPPKGGS